MQASPIRGFGLRAVLWLPLSFFVWFAFSSPLVWPVVQMAKLSLLSIWPTLFSDVVQNGHGMEVTTRLLVNQVAPDGRSGIGELVLVQNPMLYGYSLPLFSGLAMATPISVRRRLAHFAIALAVIWMAQALGVVAESFKMLAFDSGAAGANAVIGAGISADSIALAYQFGYLILPAVVPVALWIGLNRAFIESLVHPVEEPSTGLPGPNSNAQE
jgi:exosortase/archaeosortase